MDDSFALERFQLAQDENGTYGRAVAELRSGCKTSHWMWFVFPQVAGLGQSHMSRTYAISSLAEAHTYIEHPVLGPRLLECTHILTQLSGRSAQGIFGSTDAIKLRSSMTLFAWVAPAEALFRQVLDAYFDGARDAATEELMRSPAFTWPG